MSDATLLMLAIGPVSVMVKADRRSKGISEGHLARKWEMLRSASATRNEARRRQTAEAARLCSLTLYAPC